MSRNLQTSVYSLDGNSIWEVALKFERLGLQEMSKNSEVLFQGQVLDDSNIRDAIIFKESFDKFFSLYKEFHLKVAKGTQFLSDALNKELEDTFKIRVIMTKGEDPSIQTSIDNYVKTFKSPAGDIGENKTRIEGYMDAIFKKIDKVIRTRDDNLTKYAKLETVQAALDKVDDIVTLQIKPANYETKKKQIETNLKQARQQLKLVIMNELKDDPEARNPIENDLNIRLATYEGTAMNVLRDLLIISNNIVQDIRMKKLVLQEALIKEESLGVSIITDYAIINQLNIDLEGSSDVEKHYKEPYNKVVNNLNVIKDFSRDLNKVLRVFYDVIESESESEEGEQETETESGSETEIDDDSDEDNEVIEV
jgi:hypothetical protein